MELEEVKEGDFIAEFNSDMGVWEYAVIQSKYEGFWCRSIREAIKNKEKRRPLYDKSNDNIGFGGCARVYKRIKLPKKIEQAEAMMMIEEL